VIPLPAWRGGGKKDARLLETARRRWTTRGGQFESCDELQAWRGEQLLVRREWVGVRATCGAAPTGWYARAGVADLQRSWLWHGRHVDDRLIGCV